MNKKFSVVIIILMVVLISTYSSIGFIIGNDDFIKLKAKIPNYFGGLLNEWFIINF